MKKLLLCFAAGSLGALVNSLAVWQAGELGIARWAHVAIAPALAPAWLYPRIVWGGLWGLLFILPLFNARPLVKGGLISLAPTLFQLFVVFPYQAHQGVMGVGLGMWTPIFVLVVNGIWGVVTALTLRYAR